METRENRRGKERQEEREANGDTSGGQRRPPRPPQFFARGIREREGGGGKIEGGKGSEKAAGGTSWPLDGGKPLYGHGSHSTALGQPPHHLPLPPPSLYLSDPSRGGLQGLGSLDGLSPAFPSLSLPSSLSLFFSFLLPRSVYTNIPNQTLKPHRLAVNTVRHALNSPVRANSTNHAIKTSSTKVYFVNYGQYKIIVILSFFVIDSFSLHSLKTISTTSFR